MHCFMLRMGVPSVQAEQLCMLSARCTFGGVGGVGGVGIGMTRVSGIEASRFDVRCWLLHVHVARGKFQGSARADRTCRRAPSCPESHLCTLKAVPDGCRAPVWIGGHHRPSRGYPFRPLCHAFALADSSNRPCERGKHCDEKEVNMRPSRLHRPSLSATLSSSHHIFST